MFQERCQTKIVVYLCNKITVCGAEDRDSDRMCVAEDRDSDRMCVAEDRDSDRMCVAEERDK